MLTNLDTLDAPRLPAEETPPDPAKLAVAAPRAAPTLPRRLGQRCYCPCGACSTSRSPSC